MAVELKLNITMGEPKTGLWCETCTLPSRIEVPLYMLTSWGVREIKGLVYCAEHGRDDPST